MTNKIEHKFSIKRILKSTDDDYLKASLIYNDTTPFEIKTPTNEIAFWLEKQNNSSSFQIYIFVLYLNDEVIGLSMTTYINRTKIVVDEYLAVKEQYRMQTIFLSFESLIHNYYKENGIDVSYYITEISNKNNGKEVDRESLIALKLMCIEDYGKIEALYYALPLGLTNYESNFIANLYIKTVEPLKSMTTQTYCNIVESMYYDYWLAWYSPILSSAEIEIYKSIIDKHMLLIKSSVANCDGTLLVSHKECSCFNEKANIKRGTIPINKKHNISITLICVVTVLILPLVIIGAYSKLLNLFNIPFSSYSSIIGAVISTTITTLTTLFITRKKLL